MRLLALAAMVCIGYAAHAATSYTVKWNREGEIFGRGYVVVAEPTRIHASMVAPPSSGPILFDSLLWLQGSPLVALNSQMQTWYAVARPFALSCSYLNARLAKRIGKVKFTFDEVAGAPLGEHHYAGELHYVVIGAVNITYGAKFEITTTDSVDPRLWLTGMLPFTGAPELDAKLLAAESTIKGFPLRMSITATRQYSGGGALMTQSDSIEVTDVHEIKAEPSLFVQPANYRHEEPVIGVPGRSK